VVDSDDQRSECVCQHTQEMDHINGLVHMEIQYEAGWRKAGGVNIRGKASWS
jgi:hypothetical protein